VPGSIDVGWQFVAALVVAACGERGVDLDCVTSIADCGVS
jgi:hypothetical protein